MIFYKIFKAIIDAGPTVLLPIIIFILGKGFGLKFGKAVKSGIIVGVGFAGLKLVISFLTSNLGPVVDAMVKRFGLHFNTLDVGFAMTGAVGWSSPIVPFMVLAILGINILLLVIKRTNTLSVDLWNYHHCLTIGALVYFTNKNIVVATIAAGVTGLVVFKLADWSVPLIEKYYKIPGVNTPALHALNALAFAPFEYILERTPGINKINFDLKTIEKYFGTFGEPPVIGLVLGCGIAALANYPLIKIFGVGVNMATAMVLIPKMSGMFVEGLKPISEQAKLMCESKFKGRKIYIGLDPSILLGDASVITVSLIMIPISLLLAATIPQNRILPFADLGAISFKIALIVAVCKGNIFRSLIISTILMIGTLICGTDTAPLVTATAHAVGINPAGVHAGQFMTSLAGPAMLISYIILKVFTGKLIITVPAFAIAFGLIWVIVEKIQGKKKSNVQDESEAEVAAD